MEKIRRLDLRSEDFFVRLGFVCKQSSFPSMLSPLSEYRTCENRKTGRDVGREVDLEKSDERQELTGHCNRMASDSSYCM